MSGFATAAGEFNEVSQQKAAGVTFSSKEEMMVKNVGKVLSWISGSGLAFVFSASAAAAQPSLNDAQCVMLTNAYARSTKDPAGEKALFAAHFFYLGRLQTEVAHDRLASALAEAAKTVLPGLAGKMMQVCATQVQAAETDLQQAGKSLQPTAKK